MNNQMTNKTRDDRCKEGEKNKINQYYRLLHNLLRLFIFVCHCLIRLRFEFLFLFESQRLIEFKLKCGVIRSDQP